MSEMSLEFEKEYSEIIKKLILIHYPDVLIDGPKYHIPSKHLTVEIRSSAFYFSLDTSVYHHVSNFRQKGIWSFPFLQFGIQLTASTGRTYSYPHLGKIKILNQDDLLLLANYMFSCANTAILFFDYELEKVRNDNTTNPMEGLYTYKFIGGGISVKPPVELKQ